MRARFVTLLAVGLAVLVPAPAARAQRHVIHFKDGFTVQGIVKRDTTNFYDPISGQPVRIPLPGGFYTVDEGARLIIFSPNQVQDVLGAEPKKGQIVFTQEPPARASEELPSRWQPLQFGSWEAGMQRTVSALMLNRAEDVRQKITVLTPEYARVQSMRYNWVPYYLLDEIGPEAMRKMLYLYMGNSKDAKYESKYEQAKLVYRFFLQAGWVDAADRELAGLKTKNTELDDLRDGLKRYRAALFVHELDRAAKLGQHGVVRAGLKRFEEEGFDGRVDDRLLLRVQEVKKKYGDTDKQLQDSRELLKWLAQRYTTAANKAFFTATVPAILGDLNDDTVGRLETFLSLARTFKAALDRKEQPNQTSEELLSFAVSGWVLGDRAAEGDVGAARDLWAARQLAMEYLKSDDVVHQKNVLSRIGQLGVRPDVLARALPLLPPTEPFDQIDGKQHKLDAPGTGKATPYHLRLPPDYRHVGRTYPVLIVLHHSGEKADDTLKRWAPLAAQHGFILAAPARPTAMYTYSAREHAAVLDTLRDLRRRFQVDSDRVFLFGFEEGGKMAYDVGLSHPDQFAGVIPMSAAPKYFSFRYWTNGQYLPFYVVNGERSGKTSDDNKIIFKEWVRCSFPAVYVEYKGRPLEFFEAEPKFLLDWMSGKKRALPLNLGGKFEFKTMRSTDNAFYWLSTTAVLPAYINQAGPAFNTARSAATLRGEIRGNNTIYLHAGGVANVSIWLGPGMLNTTEVITDKKKGGQPDEMKVKVHVNNGRPAERSVVPSAEVLLETLNRTGDRQRLFWAKLDVILRP
jgi:pimeloyl-ACP methyl ester carboxylesterase